MKVFNPSSKRQKTPFTFSQVASYIYGDREKVKGQVVSTGNSIIRKKLRVHRSLCDQAFKTTHPWDGRKGRGHGGQSSLGKGKWEVFF